MPGFKIVSALVATAITILLASGEAQAEKRVALIIGNGSYPQVGNLANPPNDARLMTATLRQLDFEVIEKIDVDQKGLKRAISEFGQKLSAYGKDTIGLFYYAGHGVQVGGTNYLIPVNVSIGSEADVDIEAVAADAVQTQMAYAGNRMNIIIMDACRNNPFKRSFRAATRGLAKMDATKGTLIAYATAPGDVAADGGSTNSPYTSALASALLTPGLTVERVFKEVRNQVATATNSQQIPWESSSLLGKDFYFSGNAKSGGTTIAAAPMNTETVFWRSIQNSDNPADYQAYLKQYQNGAFAPLAQVKLNTLGKALNRPAPGNAGPFKFAEGGYAPRVISATGECSKIKFKEMTVKGDVANGRWTHPQTNGTLSLTMEGQIIKARLQGRYLKSSRESIQIQGSDLLIHLDIPHDEGSCKLALQIDGLLTY